MYIFSRRHQLRHCRPLMYSTQQIDHPKNSALALPFKSFLTGPAEYMGTVGKLSPFNFSNPISIGMCVCWGGGDIHPTRCHQFRLCRLLQINHPKISVWACLSPLELEIFHQAWSLMSVGTFKQDNLI